MFIRCRKLNISLVFITQLYFSVPKDVRLNSTPYLIMKINEKRELQNIATNHSADIDYNDFVNIYRGYTRKPFTFLTIDTTLPASDSLKFRKYYFLLVKMAVTDQLKIIDDKIKSNRAQYDLDRLAAKISALPSGESRKYEYLTGEDLGYQASVLEQKKLIILHWVEFSIRGWIKVIKKKGCLRD